MPASCFFLNVCKVIFSRIVTAQRDLEAITVVITLESNSTCDIMIYDDDSQLNVLIFIRKWKKYTQTQ